MRLGKTLIAIRWIKKLGLKNVLVLLPLQSCEGWQKELFLEREKFVSAYDMPPEERKAIVEYARGRKQRTWVLMNYEGLPVLSQKKEYSTKKIDKDGKTIKSTEYEIPEIAYMNWDAVILDESPKIKTPGTVLSEICTQGFRSAKHRAILTGAIQTEGPHELFQQFKFLDGHFMGFSNFYQFRFKFFEKDGYAWVPKEGAEQQIQEHVHKCCFIRKRSDVGLKEKKIRERRYVNMSAKQKKLYRGIEEEFTAYLLSGGTWETEYALVRRNWLAKLAGGFDAENNLVCGAKADDIIDLLRGELSGEKLCIWFRYRHELEHVCRRLNKANISNTWIMGGLSGSERKTRMDLFRGKTRVLCATEDSLKHGVDASVCDTSYYYSNSDSGDSRIQSEDRVVNPFTKSLDTPILLIDSITRGSIDLDIVDSIHDKLLKTRLFHLSPEKRYFRRLGI
jgi:SNF2 family DNA or RNA helicase